MMEEGQLQEQLCSYAGQEQLSCSAIRFIQHRPPATIVHSLLVEHQQAVVTKQADSGSLLAAVV
jgi:hypothetical protein